MTKPLTIRAGVRADFPEILRIENACFEDPRDEAYFKQIISDKNSVLKVVEVDHFVVAYMVYLLWTDQIHIDSLAVIPELQRRGFGGALLTNVLDRLRGKYMTVDVEEYLLPAQLFFSKLGFKATTIFNLSGHQFITMSTERLSQPEGDWSITNRITSYHS